MRIDLPPGMVWQRRPDGSVVVLHLNTGATFDLYGVNPLMFYILDKDNQPVPESDGAKWAFWLERDERRIVRHTPLAIGPDVIVSTVFLGIDHDFSMKGPPVLWETMAFNLPAGHPFEHFQDRYTSMEAAIAGHMAVVDALMAMEEHDGPFEGGQTEKAQALSVRPTWKPKVSGGHEGASAEREGPGDPAMEERTDQ